MFCAAIAGLLGFSSAALTSLAGASVIGLYLSYVTPIFLRITSGRDKFKPGPFHLGKWSTPLGIIAVAWVNFVCILLLFPPSQVTNVKTMSALLCQCRF
jgi:amino acid transporter